MDKINVYLSIYNSTPFEFVDIHIKRRDSSAARFDDLSHEQTHLHSSAHEKSQMSTTDDCVTCVVCTYHSDIQFNACICSVNCLTCDGDGDVVLVASREWVYLYIHRI